MAVGLMAPFGGLVCGLFFLAFLGYTDSTTDSIPLDMKKDIETLRRTISPTEKGNSSGPVFLHVLADLEKMAKKDDQKLLLLEMLHIYFDMFSNMQEKAKDPDARKAACELRRHVDNLINGYYICNKHLRKMLQEIRAMGKQLVLGQRVNSSVQLKALEELQMVYHKASELRNNKCLQRRRRHLLSLRCM